MTRAHGPLESKAAKGSPGTRLREHEHFRSPRRSSPRATRSFSSRCFSPFASTNESPEAWAQDKMIDKISLIWAHTPIQTASYYPPETGEAGPLDLHSEKEKKKAQGQFPWDGKQRLITTVVTKMNRQTVYRKRFQPQPGD